MRGPSFVIGAIAKGEDFWCRGELVKEVWSAIEKNNVIIKAPRRFGKSSVMTNMLENPIEGWKVFYIDVESMRTPEEFISGLITHRLKDSTIGTVCHKGLVFLKEKFPEIEVGIKHEDMPEIRLALKEKLKDDWKEEGRKLIGRLEGYKGKVLFILDELPELIKHIERNKDQGTCIEFLHWLRELRQGPELGHIRWIVGGSIGIEHVIKKVGAGVATINDFENIAIEPFTDESAKGLIQELLKSKEKEATANIIDEFINTLGIAVPYFLQILLKECVYEMDRRGEKSLTSEVIKEAYQNRMLGSTNRSYFEHYYTRLKEYYDDDMEKAAKAILLEIARSVVLKKADLNRLFVSVTEGRCTDDDFARLMSDLENDFYITYDTSDKSYSFSTNVLRDWWLRYHDMVEE